MGSFNKDSRLAGNTQFLVSSQQKTNPETTQNWIVLPKLVLTWPKNKGLNNQKAASINQNTSCSNSSAIGR
jgi:hypothetical protein